MVSIVFGSTAKRRMAINAEAPQSTSTPPAGVSSKMHVCSRPPLPNASPLPRNRIRTPSHYRIGGGAPERRVGAVAGVAHAPALIEPVVLTALDRFLGGPG